MRLAVNGRRNPMKHCVNMVWFENVCLKEGKKYEIDESFT